MPSTAPPDMDFRPRAVLRLGFAGHRPGRLMGAHPSLKWDELECRIRTTLNATLDHLEAAMRPFDRGGGAVATLPTADEWRDDYASRRPLIRLVCGAAMGADHIALNAAKDRRAKASNGSSIDWEIVCILPCDHERFIAEARPDVSEQFSTSFGPSGSRENEYWRAVLDIPDRLVVLPSSWRTKVPGEQPGDPSPSLSGGSYNPYEQQNEMPSGFGATIGAAQVGETAPLGWSLDHTPTAEFLLGEIDLLIVVWDKGKARGPGGAPDLAAKAHEAGIPVLVIDPKAPKSGARRLHSVEREPHKFETRHWYRGVISGATESSHVDSDHMANIVRNLLQRPPEGGGADIPGVNYQDFLNDREEPGIRHSIYDRVVQIFRACGPSSPHHIPHRLAASSKPMSAEERWKAHLSQRPSPAGGRSLCRKCPQQDFLMGTLLHRYTHADALARGYGMRYHRAYTLLYLLAAFAASLAVFGLVQTIMGMRVEPKAGGGPSLGWKGLLVLIEIGILLWMYFAHRRSRKYCFHERYLDYGALAASLRQLRSLSTFSEFPKSAQRFQGEGRWWQWYVMATAREIGPPDGELLPAWQRTTIQGLIDHELEEQAQRANEVLAECAGTEAGAHALGWWFFVLTFVSLILLLFVMYFSTFWTLAAVLGAMAAILPIFGAALLGIVQTADFEARASRARLALVRISRQKEALERVLPEQGYDETRRALLATVRLAARDLEAFLKLHTHRPLVMPS